MKILKNQNFSPFDPLLAWNELSHETRLLFLTQIDSTLKVSEKFFSPAQISELIDAGFHLPDRPLLHPEIHPFRNLMRSMFHHQHFNLETELDLDYVTDHLTQFECEGIFLSNGFHFHKPAQRAKDAAVESLWINQFLQADSFESWENRQRQHENPYLNSTSAALLKKWIERLIQGTNPIPLAALLDGNPDPETALAALRAGVRYLLLFPALDPETLLPIIGIWPKIHSRLNRKTLEQPSPVELPDGCETYSTPILLHDLTTLLIGTTGDGLRLKAQGGLYKKEEEALAARLLPLPSFGRKYQARSSVRLDEAHRWLFDMKFVKSKGTRGKTLALKATEKGKKWLSGSESERLNAVVDHLRAAHKKNKEGDYFDRDNIRFAPSNPQTYTTSGEFNLEEKLIQTISNCPEGQWIELQPFLQWNIESNNPLLSGEEITLDRIFSRWNSSDSAREESWRNMLKAFLTSRLMPSGGAKIAFNAQGTLWFSITPIGTYLLGQTDTFDHQTETVEGGIIVQPTFEIIFTAANPFAEGELTRYAERIGHGIGTLFRITRPSIHLALNSGMESDQILESLQPLSQKKLPKNVVAQIQDWGKSFRRVAIKNITIIRCPDAETALRVQALYPQKTEPITDTLLQINNQKDLAPLKKKLRENGIGIE